MQQIGVKIMNFSTAKNTGKEVTKNNPCPLCGKTDWCLESHDLSLVICGRTDKYSLPTGWGYIGDTNDGRPMYRRQESGYGDTHLNTAKNTSKRKDVNTKQGNRVPNPKPTDKIQISYLSDTKSYAKIISGEEWLKIAPKYKSPTLGVKPTDTVISYSYSDTQRVVRIESGSEKKRFSYLSKDAQGNWVAQKGDGAYPLYRNQDLSQVSGQWVGVVEGEKCAETIATTLGLVALSPCSTDWGIGKLKTHLQALKDAGTSGIYCLPDNDSEGVRKASTVESVAKEIGLPCIVVDLTRIVPNLIDKGDIVDVIDYYNSESVPMEDLIKRLEKEIHQAIKDKYYEQEQIPKDTPPTDSQESQKKGDKFTPQKATNLFIEDRSGSVRYDLGMGMFRLWNGKNWEAKKDKVMDKEIIKLLEYQDKDYNSDTFISGVRKLLAAKLLVEQWKEPTGTHLNFNNGVLNLETNELESHNPKYNFTHVLEHDYHQLDNLTGDTVTDLKEHCPNTYRFFHQAIGGDDAKTLQLLGIINGIIKKKFSEYQRFLHFMGKPATGKGTFVRFLQDIVGTSNHESARINLLGDNPTMAKIIEKQLVICPDEDKTKSGYGAIKSLTGGDSISYRQLYKESCSKRFTGTLVVVSNGEVFTGDTVGLERRTLQVNFNNSISTEQRDPYLNEKLAKEIPNLFPIVLSMSDSLVKDLIMGVGVGDIADNRVGQWESTCDGDSVADWINEHIIFGDEYNTQIGDADGNLCCLYPHYLDYCKRSKLTPVTLKNFSKRVMSHSHGLGYSVGKKRSKAGFVLVGVKLRDDADTLPTIGEILAGKNEKNKNSEQPYTPYTNSLNTSPNKDSDSTYNSTPHKSSTYTGAVSGEKVVDFLKCRESVDGVIPIPTDENDTDDSSDDSQTSKGVGLPYTGVGKGVGLKPLPGKGGVGCVGSGEKLFSKQKSPQKPDSPTPLRYLDEIEFIDDSGTKRNGRVTDLKRIKNDIVGVWDGDSRVWFVTLDRITKPVE